MVLLHSGIVSCVTSIYQVCMYSNTLSLHPFPQAKLNAEWHITFSFLFGFLNYSLPLLLTWLIDTDQFCCCVSSGLAWIQKSSHVQLKTDHGRNPFINPGLWGNNESTEAGKILRYCKRESPLIL